MSNVKLIKRIRGLRLEINGGDVTAYGIADDGQWIAATVCNGGDDAIDVATAALFELIQEANNATPK